MPLPKRLVEPVHVGRGTLPDNFPLPSELEAVTNGTLANTVRQLSSLSRHAEDLFGELARDASHIQDRSNSLQARIDRLAVKVTQLDSTVEEVSLQDIHMRKAFKSAVIFDQQIFSRATMPTAMLETYKACDRPPPLDKLNCYRDDGKDGLKFYTDPNYFFELWRQEMLKDTERMMHDRGKKPHRPQGQGGRHKRKVRQPHNTRERQRQIAVHGGEHLMPQNIQYRAPEDIRPPRPDSIELRRSYPMEMPDVAPILSADTPTKMLRPSQPPPAPPSNTSTPSSNTPTRGRSISSGRDNLPPPPPPPETVMSPPNGIITAPHLLARSRSNSPHSYTATPEPQHELPPPPPAPPAPPPPPPLPPSPTAVVSNGPTSPPLVNGVTTSPPKLTPVKERPKQAVDPRNDLLKAIRDGITLRKVEKKEQKEVERGNGLHDVASILARRVAVEFSDSDSASESECDSEGWGENETSA